MPSAPGCPGFRDYQRLLLKAKKELSQLAGISQCCRAQNAHRVGVVARTDPFKALQKAGHVRTKDPAVDVGLVQHNERERGQKGSPALVPGQNPQMQHFRIRDQHCGRVLAYSCPFCLVRVPVVEGYPGPCMLRPAKCQAFQGLFLVLGKGLQGEEVEGSCIRVQKPPFQKGQVVDKGLAAGCWRCHHHVLARSYGVHGVGLMGVERRNPHALQNLAYGPWVRPFDIGRARRLLLKDLVAGDRAGIDVLFKKRLNVVNGSEHGLLLAGSRQKKKGGPLGQP